MVHEGMLVLFRNRPELAAELLRDGLGVALPRAPTARVASAELTEVAPTEYRADLVVLLGGDDPAHGIIVEVQLRRDVRKRRTWPAYLANLFSRFGCPVSLLVVAPDARVAKWCATPIPLGHPGFTLQPLVVAPNVVPKITDATKAREDPELAVLSAMTHGSDEAAVGIADAALRAAPCLDDERGRLYHDLVVGSLGDAARKALEELMESGNYEYQTDFARKYLAQGRQEGRQEGRVEGEAEALLAVLSARGISVSVADRARIRGCTDLKQLRAWIRQAATAESARSLFSRAAAPPRRRTVKRPSAPKRVGKR